MIKIRLLHFKTIEYVINADDSVFKNATVSRKQVLAHAWSECFKYLGQDKTHPKVSFLTRKEVLLYLNDYHDTLCRYQHKNNVKLFNYDETKFLELCNKFNWWDDLEFIKYDTYTKKEVFDDMYLFSDLTSLYFKGVNLFPLHFGDQWRKYVPVESLKEIERQVKKTLDKRGVKR